MYSVVLVGEKIGFKEFVLLIPVVGDHEKLLEVGGTLT